MSTYIYKQISPIQIYEKLNKIVMGQYSAKKIISNAFFTNIVNLTKVMAGEKDKYTPYIPLLTGPSGNGKTFLIKEAIKIIKELCEIDLFNVLEVDCTSLTPSGYRGVNIDTLLETYVRRNDMKFDGYRTTLIYFDEFDKICLPSEGSQPAEFYKLVQYDLLKLLENPREYVIDGEKKGIVLDASLWSFIFSGNFPDIRKNRDKSTGSIGFLSSIPETNNIELKRQLQNSGLTTQIAGRVTTAVELEYLTEKELEDILRKNIIPEIIDFYSKLNYTLYISDEQVNRIIKKTTEAKLGARGLKENLEKELENILFEQKYKFIIAAEN